MLSPTFNGTTRRITLAPGTVTLDLISLWSWYKLWLAAGNAENLLAMATVGGDITEIPLYLFMQNGWLIVPQSADHTLTVVGGILVGQSGADPFADPAGSYKIRINRQTPGIAIGYSATSGNVYTLAEISSATQAAVPTALNVSDAVWGNAFVSRLLTIAKFLSLK